MNILHFKTLLQSFALLLFLPSTVIAQVSIDSTLASLLDFSAPIVKVGDLDKAIDVQFLDAREIEEYNVSHIPNAKFISFENFSNKKLKQIFSDKAQPIIVYCSIGYRSEIITNRLLKLGYTDVLNLYGGIFEWKNNNNEVVNAHGFPTDSVHVYSEEWSNYMFNGVKVY